jgi:hypothetical protein
LGSNEKNKNALSAGNGYHLMNMHIKDEDEKEGGEDREGTLVKADTLAVLMESPSNAISPKWSP